MASITLEKLTKRYPGGVEPVKAIDLHVPHGAFVCLVGPSGCGKSTTLSLIAGLDSPTSGRIRFDETDVTALSPRDRDVAMVFQSYALYPHKSVFENLAFPLRNAGVARSEIDRRVRLTADRLGLHELLRRMPRELSGGQRQRVALGRAMVREPKVFLFDEPLSNLDPALRGQMRAELKRLHEELGATFIYVTHDQAEAMTLADRVVVLSAGVIQQDAPPGQVYRQPATLFVAQFMGSPPMSILHARVTAGQLATQAGTLRLPGLEPLEGQEVLVGIRSEDARIEAGNATLSGRVDVTEPLGAETQVTVRLTGGDSLVVRAQPSFAAPRGAEVQVAVDASHLHLFDPRTRRRVGAFHDRLN
jgi:ABC-type sugar transport system ATPase subunit